MYGLSVFSALILGIVEGLTEFLPISSTGHLILAARALGAGGEKAKTFEIFIQLGAILAVAWVTRGVLISAARGPFSVQSRRFFFNIFLAFVPAAVTGFFFHSAIKHYLFSPVTVAAALIAGGCAILYIEAHMRASRTDEVTGIGPGQAFGVGCAQILSLMPGVSRAAATIMGGLLSGMNRRTATEFSFFLAIPTMFAATMFDLYKSRDLFALHDTGVLAAGFVAAFVSALWVVRWLLKYVSRHDFKPFAWYRIALGILVLGVHYIGK